MKKIDRREFIKTSSLGLTSLTLAGKLGVDFSQAQINPSRVVVVENRDVYPGEENSPEALIVGEVWRMLEQALFTLTGQNTRREAWASLGFQSTDTVGIKVNGIAASFYTSRPLVSYVIEGLKSAGIEENNIIIFDRAVSEAERAGYDENTGPGIKVVDSYEYGVRRRGRYEVSQVVTDRVDKLINMPVLKQHPKAGLTFSLKNNLGVITDISGTHSNNCDPAIFEVNNVEELRNKQVLIVGDMTFCVRDRGPRGPITDCPKKVIVGFDPVAIDYYALGILNRYRQEAGLNPETLSGRARHIRTAKQRELGDWEQAEYLEIDVTQESIDRQKPARREKGEILLYPQPANPSVYFSFPSSQEGPVKVKIYNNLGQLIREMNLDYKKPGEKKTIFWDGKDARGRAVNSGSYFFQIFVGNEEQFTQTVILK